MVPIVGFETAKKHSKPLSEFRATVEVSKWLQEVKGNATKRTYSSALFRYWNEFLSKKYASLAEWIQAVRTQRESKEPMVRKTWVSDVRTFMDTGRISNDKPMSTPTKELLASSVKSFLRAWVDEEPDHDFKVKYPTEGLQKK